MKLECYNAVEMQVREFNLLKMAKIAADDSRRNQSREQISSVFKIAQAFRLHNLRCQARGLCHAYFTNSTKFFSSCSPTFWLFSG